MPQNSSPLNPSMTLVDVGKVMAETFLTEGTSFGMLQVGIECDDGTFVIVNIAMTAGHGRREDMLPGTSPPVQL